MSLDQLTVSLVSHGHGSMVEQALESLALSLQGSDLSVRVLLTLNLPEPDLERSLQSRDWPFALEFIRNPAPLGFGANHNQAFALCRSPWFAVVNPDVFWSAGDVSFWQSLAQSNPSRTGCGSHSDVCGSTTLSAIGGAEGAESSRTGCGSYGDRVGLVCPLQLDADGLRQDFTRALMTPWGLLGRVWRRWRGVAPSGVAASVAEADWVNGACMFFRAQAFAQVKGFDERYFMYCEDTDICLRLQLAGWSMQGVDWAVVHDARRNTGRSWRHLAWHLRSMLRLWLSGAFWRFVMRH
jgi:N-acetylglucosaminyl-diphospho-decaprenol L-rhamnosyltransferase